MSLSILEISSSISVLVLIINSKSLETANISKSVFDRSKIPKNASKYWFAYIKAIVFISMKQSVTKYESLTFSEYRNFQIFDMKSLIDRKHSNVYFVENDPFNKSDANISVSNIYGQLIAQSNVTIYNIEWDVDMNMCKENIDYHFVHKWMFNLEKNLRLNITFVYFSIYIFDTKSCDIGHVSIVNNNTKKFKYCGTYSFLKYYSNYSKVDIHLSIRKYVLLEIDSIFSIVDKESAVTVKTFHQGNNKFLWLWRIIFPLSLTEMRRYHVQVSKLKYIKLILQPSSCNLLQAYDGPGSLSNPLLPRSKNRQLIIVSNSFQVSLFVNMLYGCSDNIGITFLSVYHIVLKNHSLNLHVPYFIFNSQDCYYKDRLIYLNQFQTPRNVTANITIVNITHNFERNFHCQYGGVSFFENRKEEISTECLSHYGAYSYRNIYPQSSQFIILLYSYLNYGKIHFSLEISFTHCRAVRINFCLELLDRKMSLADNNRCVVYQLSHKINSHKYRHLIQHTGICPSCANNEFTIELVKSPKKTLNIHLSAYYTS